MKKFLGSFLVLFMGITSSYSQTHQLPKGFVYLKNTIPSAIFEIRYAGSHNFVGKPIEGYENPVAILSIPAAVALQKVQEEVMTMGYSLKIFDAYRPQRAVNHFIRWAKKPNDTLMKQEFYPNIKKRNLFRLGYIATRSGHSRGSTVDLTLVDCQTRKELNMGGTYDFFGDISHHSAMQVSLEEKENREYLKKVMLMYGFRPYSEEWWHYTLKNEPYPNTYFDFKVE